CAFKVIEPVVGIQGFVTEEIIAGAMQLIGAGFYCDADNAVAGLAIFGGKIALQYTELIDGVGGDTLVPLGVGRYERNRNAIHENVCPALLPPVNFKVVAGVAPGIVVDASDESRNKFNKLDGVTNRAVNLKRQILNERGLDRRADFRGGGLELRGIRCN